MDQSLLVGKPEPAQGLNGNVQDAFADLLFSTLIEGPVKDPVFETSLIHPF